MTAVIAVGIVLVLLAARFAFIAIRAIGEDDQ